LRGVALDGAFEPLGGVRPESLRDDRGTKRLRTIKSAVEEPPQLTKPPTEPEANLRLTGVAFLEGKRWALLIQEKRGQPPRHLTLQEGEKIDGLEVRQVDVERGGVLAIANGKDTRVSFAAQDTEMHAARQAEKQFVDEHTRAHEALQRRERERLARAINAP
jgi:type II secretory pathway component PulC